MANDGLELFDLKYVLNCVSEAIVVSDEEYNIVSINDAAVNKLYIDYDTVYNKKLLDFIPSEELPKVQNAIKTNSSEYYEIHLKRENNELFPALVSGKELRIREKKYRISTIIDVSELKNKEKMLILQSKDQVKQLKHHLISKVTQGAKEVNKIKGKSNVDLSTLHNQSIENEITIINLTKKVKLLTNENNLLEKEIDRLKDDSFGFNDLLELEIAKSKKFKTKFSLCIISIHNFASVKESINSENKVELILKAIKRQFKQSLRTMDVVLYDKEGVFNILLPNWADVNITDIIDKLVVAKGIGYSTSLTFDYGLSHFYEKDTSEAIIYRAKKNLKLNQNEKR